MTAHSKLGASSMHRWSACPGSVRQCEGIEKTASVYAEEGTDAHTLAATCLAFCDDPTRVIDSDMEGAGKNVFKVTAEMAEAVQVYVDHLNNTFERGDVDQIEQRFDLSAVHPGCFGTADHVRWRASEKLLIVTDYKHGAGIPVGVESNPQLMYYGLGALLASGLPAMRVRLAIVQPRCAIDGEAVRSWEIDAIDLIDFKADLVVYAKATEQPDAPLVPGDHCRFCPAAPLCPAIHSRAQEVARMTFTVAQPYDPAQLKLALDSRDVLKGWLTALDEFAYAEAEAGRCPPGYKLVDKRATRKWTSEGEVIEHLTDLGLAQDLIYEPRSIKSPAQMEKIVKKGSLDSFITKESSGHALVPEGDKRPAITVATARDVFAPVDPLALPAFLDRSKPVVNPFD